MKEKIRIMPILWTTLTVVAFVLMFLEMWFPSLMDGETLGQIIGSILLLLITTILVYAFWKKKS